MGLNLKAEIRGVTRITSAIKRFQKEKDYAMETAIKVAGFKYKNKLQADIRRGAPGGRQFSDLTEISRATGRPRNRTALRRLAHGIRYSVKHKKPYTVAVGFTNYVQARRSKGFTVLSAGIHSVSGNWLRKGEIHQEGFSRRITEKQRRYFARIGAQRMGWRDGKANIKKYAGVMASHRDGELGGMPFFIKKTTTHFRTPARPIIKPFWQANRRKIWRDINTLFRRKMNGAKI